MKSLSRAEKTLATVSLLSLLIIGGGILLYRAGASSSAVIPPPLPLPKPNGFDAYVAAATAIIPANPAVDAVNDRTSRTPQQAATLYTSKRRRIWIASNAKAWALMSQAKTLPCRAPNMRGMLTTFPAWAQLRELTRCQTIRITEAKYSGQWNEAANLGLDSLEMGYNVERGSNLIGSLVSIAIEAISERSLEDVPSHLSAAEAKAAAKRLETMLDNAQPFSEVLAEEKWGMLTMLDRLGPTSGVSAVVKTVLMPRTDITGMMDRIAAQAAKPKGKQTLPPPTGGITGTNARTLYPVMTRSLDNDTRRKASQRLLLLRFALRAHRLEHGAYPKTLTSLAPQYLRKIPIDPYGKGETFHYIPQGDTYTLWSIGPDLVDNKATPIKPRGSQKRAVVSFNSKGDIVVRP